MRFTMVMVVSMDTSYLFSRKKHLVLMENMIYGNATYVFRDNWEELSKLSKAEIIKNNLQDKRFVHRESWPYQISALLR